MIQMKYMRMFTHNDLDGVACGILGSLAADESDSYFEVEYCTVGNINRAVSGWLDQTKLDPRTDYVLLITDISVDVPTAKRLDSIAKRNKNVRIQVLDHHEPEAALLRMDWVKVETSTDYCGTNLLYHWLTENGLIQEDPALNQFAEDVCLYDTWRFEQEDDDETSNAERLNTAMHLMGREAFFDFATEWFSKDEKAPLIIEDIPEVNRFVEKDLDNCWNYCVSREKGLQTMEYKGMTIGYVFAEQYVSKLAHFILEDNPDIDIAAIITMPGVVSLRAVREDINLGTGLAKAMGGGGHAHAAAYHLKQIPEEIVRKMLKFD